MKIAIAGYGQEGRSSYRYWSADPKNELTVFDENKLEQMEPDGVFAIIGTDAFSQLNGYDLVIRTAGLAPSKIVTDGKIWSATNEFFAKCPAPIIGVTGTKGKGTTASLMASIFEAAGKKVWLLGNIGTPSLDSLRNIKSDDIVIYELSSFQLWDLEYSPHVAVVLLIEPDHLNVHIDFDDYVNAKANIRRFQKVGDLCVFNASNELSLKIANASDTGKAVRYAVPDDGGVYVRDGSFRDNEHIICSIDALQLIGNHNVENACAALTVARFYKLTDVDIESGLRKFQGLPHRIEFVREIDGVKYYNDSFSSAPSATVAAIKSFKQPEVLILGGIDKGADFSELADAIAGQKNIKSVIIMGEIRQKLAEIIQTTSPILQVETTDLTTLQPIVELAKSYAQPGDVVVMSPGCASFDMFNNFYDRGDQFRNIVNNL